MRSASSPASRPVSIDDLVALNAEIAALTRAGVPLDQGLMPLGKDMPGRLGRLAEDVAARTSQGMPLPEAIDASAADLPAAYRAVLQAGIRAGSLSSALESTATMLRRLSDLQRMFTSAAAYPLVVLAFAVVGFAVLASQVAPRWTEAAHGLDASAPLIGWLAPLGPSAPVWGSIGVLAILAVAGMWWYLTSRARTLDDGTLAGLQQRIPLLGSALRNARMAAYLETLALLAESQVPLPDALCLAADTVGDSSLRHSAARVADGIREGRGLGDPSFEAGGVPALMRWYLVAGQRQGTLVASLRHAAAHYHGLAESTAHAAGVLLPALLLVGLGGIVLGLYALTVFLPYVTLLKALT